MFYIKGREREKNRKKTQESKRKLNIVKKNDESTTMTTSEQNSISEYQLAKALAQTAGCAAPGSKYMILQFQELQGRIPPLDGNVA